ncbi:T9SS type A sorting domain-containing protein [Lacinutrix undariae]
MKKNYILNIKRFSILLIFSSSFISAQVSENFDNLGLVNNNGTTSSEIVGNWTFSMDAPDFIATPNFNEQGQNLNNSGNPNDRCLLMNLNSFSIRVFTLKTTNGDEFNLESMAFGLAVNDSGLATSFEFEAFRNGISVTSPESLNITSSDNVGNVYYNFIATTDGGSYGNITFQSAYDNIDEIRITANGTASIEIDDIIASSPTLGSDEFFLDNNPIIYPNPSKNFIQISGLKKNEKYTIYNIIGTQIKNGMVTNNDKIDIQSQPNGLYFLKFENGNTIKFIKE